MKKTLSLILLTCLFFSCQQEGRVYVQHQDLSPNVEWLRKDVREFKVPIENKDIDYNLSLSFRYATGYQYQIARLKVTEISPSGKETSKNHELKIRKDNGDYIGDPGYDIWDSEHMIEADKKYEETGTYTYLIEHIMPNDPLHFAMAVGVILDKSNIDE